METANEAGLTTLLAVLAATQAVEDATADGSTVTILAPVNAAFDDALEILGLTLDELLANTEKLKEIVLYHLLPTPLLLKDISGNGMFKTLLESSSTCGVGDLAMEVGRALKIIGGETSARALVVDIQTCSGVVHVIDNVLLPCPFAASPAQSPADDRKIPSATAPAIDETDKPMPIEPSVDTITVMEDAGLTTLVELLGVAGLEEAVQIENLTIFAPTNDAFLPALERMRISMEYLLERKDLLRETLSYHMLLNPYTAADFGEGGSFKTFLGDKSSCGQGYLNVVVNQYGVIIAAGVTNAQVVTSVEAGTSIIHIIDNILFPCTYVKMVPSVPITSSQTKQYNSRKTAPSKHNQPLG